MLESMRRLHPRGAANRGICVDAEGATLGPDCTLVCRDSSGYPTVDRDTASDLQKCVLDIDRDRDWLFQQCRRIADALNKGEVALAQVYGLHIPIGDLDDRTLRRIAAVELAKGGFKPDEPRLPKGGPHGGEWTSGGDGGDNDSGRSAPIALDGMTVETPAPASAPTSSEGPIKWGSNHPPRHRSPQAAATDGRCPRPSRRQRSAAPTSVRMSRSAAIRIQGQAILFSTSLESMRSIPTIASKI